MTPALRAHVHTADPEHLYRHGLSVGAREPQLRGLLLDMLATPGALTRLRLGLLAGEVLGLPDAPTRAFATALEYFHTASLLFDDLPCMDDAAERRGRPCAHRQYGEAATILAALAFINRSYALMWAAFADAASDARTAAAAHAERCLGEAGVLDGQSLDLQFARTDRSPRAVAQAALGKTVALLRLTFVTPALLAGVGVRERLLLDRLSVYWGLAYQTADDCADLITGPARPAKTGGRDVAGGRPNFAIAAGTELTAARLDRLLELVRRTWAALIAVRPGWSALGPLVLRLNQAVLVAASTLPAEIADRRCA